MTLSLGVINAMNQAITCLILLPASRRLLSETVHATICLDTRKKMFISIHPVRETCSLLARYQIYSIPFIHDISEFKVNSVLLDFEN